MLLNQGRYVSCGWVAIFDHQYLLTNQPWVITLIRASSASFSVRTVAGIFPFTFLLTPLRCQHVSYACIRRIDKASLSAKWLSHYKPIFICRIFLDPLVRSTFSNFLSYSIYSIWWISHRKLIANPPQHVRLKRSPIMDDLRMKFPEGWFVTGTECIGKVRHQI